MKLLLTNDDGIEAPGLQALLQAARLLGDPVLVAPLESQSGCGHRVTTDNPIRIEHRATASYAVHGTPADCVRVGLHKIISEPAWVLAGVNAGGNLGADIYHSGTVAAVREAALHGRPGIAISHYRKKGWTVDWERASFWIGPLLRALTTQPWTRGTFWNVNLPHLAPGA